jgi:hypothetical protein
MGVKVIGLQVVGVRRKAVSVACAADQEACSGNVLRQRRV